MAQELSNKDFAVLKNSSVWKQLELKVLNGGEDDREAKPYHWLEGDSLAPPCPSDLNILPGLLDLIEPYVWNDELVQPDPVLGLASSAIVYDIGCGDGRVCMAISRRFGCTTKGIDIEEVLIEEFRENVKDLSLNLSPGPRAIENYEKLLKNTIDNEEIKYQDYNDESFSSLFSMKLTEKIHPIHGDLLEKDLSDATIITMFLLPEAMETIKEKLIEALEKDIIVVCQMWRLKGLPYTKSVVYGDYSTPFYLYTKENLKDYKKE